MRSLIDSWRIREKTSISLSALPILPLVESMSFITKKTFSAWSLLIILFLLFSCDSSQPADSPGSETAQDASLDLAITTYSLNTSAEAVAIHGDRAAVVTEEGELVVFQFDGTSWIEAARPAAIDLSYGPNAIPIKIDLYEEQIILSDVNQEAVYVLIRENGVWIEEQRLSVPSDFIQRDFFRRYEFAFDAVLDKNRIVVSAPTDTPCHTSLGSVIVFEKRDSVWVRTADISKPETFGTFGAWLALDGNFLLVGTNQRNFYCGAGGYSLEEARIYAYSFKNGQWGDRQELLGFHATNSFLLDASTVLPGIEVRNERALGATAGFYEHEPGPSTYSDGRIVLYEFIEDSWLRKREIPLSFSSEKEHTFLLKYASFGGTDYEYVIAIGKEVNWEKDSLYVMKEAGATGSWARAAFAIPGDRERWSSYTPVEIDEARMIIGGQTSYILHLEDI